MTQAPRQDTSFSSHGLRCAAWFYPAPGLAPSALVIMAHGLGATRELGLDAYARHFQAAGFGVLVFDYRHYGGSEGEPRELMSIGKQLADWRAAIAFGKTLPNIDPNRVAIWGSSFGGGHVIRLASEKLGIVAAVSQVPFSNGLASTLTIPTVTALLITLNALIDVVRQSLGLSPRYIGLVGKPGEVAMMTAADCSEGYMKLVPPEVLASGAWRNRMSARAGLVVPMYMPGRRAAKIAIPILFAVAENDTIAPAAPTHAIAKRVSRAEVKSYPNGHFDYYSGTGFEQIVADELDFLTRHLLS
ncbi:MAG: alpha/beta hydrolase [Comamonadaceae bacterium]|nr:MAG: alpha/beta hydrolase [Comamonadaceae bacterium]